MWRCDNVPPLIGRKGRAATRFPIPRDRLPSGPDTRGRLKPWPARIDLLVGPLARPRGSIMAKDKKISELSGITPAAVMGLNRSGIVTVNDLVLAEFDKVAYLL